jgi:hypothetical protein
MISCARISPTSSQLTTSACLKILGGAAPYEYIGKIWT